MKLGAAGQVHHLHERPGALLEPANLGAHHREVLPRLPRRRHLLHRLSERDVRGGKLLSPDVQRGYVVPSLPILRIHLRAPDEGAEGFLLAIRLEQGVAAAEPSVGEERVGLHRLGPVLGCGFPILAERGSPGQRPHGARVLALAHLERLYEVLLEVQSVAQGAPELRVGRVDFQTSPDRIRGGLLLPQQREAHDERVPQLNLLEELQRRAHHAQRHEVIAELLAEHRAGGEPRRVRVTNPRSRRRRRRLQRLDQILHHEQRSLASPGAFPLVPRRQHRRRRPEHRPGPALGLHALVVGRDGPRPRAVVRH